MAQRKSESIWKQTIADCKASGLSARQWCEKNNINLSTYKCWLTRTLIVVSGGIKALV